MIEIRRPPSHMSYVHRFASLSSLEQMELRQTRKSILEIMILKETAESGVEDHVEMMLQYLILQYKYIVLTIDIPMRVRIKPTERRFNHFTESYCYNHFRFNRADLHRLYHALRLDQFNGTVKMDNGSKFETEEVMMITLSRLAYPQKFGLMVSVFGRDWTALCRAFNWLACFIRTHYGHLLTANLSWWRPELGYCARFAFILA